MSTAREPTLTKRDHLNMDAFLAHVLAGFKSGRMTEAQAVGGIAHVIAAVDRGNYDEARRWLEEGRKFIADGS